MSGGHGPVKLVRPWRSHPPSCCCLILCGWAALLGYHSCSRLFATANPTWVGLRNNRFRPAMRMSLTEAGNINPWEVLGISYTASQAEIKKAFREKIRKAHPDAGGNPEEFQQIQAAYKAALEQQGRPPVSMHPSSPTGFETAQRTTSQSYSRSSWNVKDFYQWRREQVSREYQQWEKDSDWQGEQEKFWARGRSTATTADDFIDCAAEEAGYYTSWYGTRPRDSGPPAEDTVDKRYRWPAAEQRRRQEESHRQEAEDARREQEQELRSALRDHGAGSVGGRKRSSRARGDHTKWDWAEFTPDSFKSQKTAKEQSGRQRSRVPRSRDKVVSHREISTMSGSKKVPIYLAPCGTYRYYFSPATAKKVRLPL